MSLNDDGKREMRRDWVRKRPIWPQVASVLQKTGFLVNKSSEMSSIDAKWPETPSAISKWQKLTDSLRRCLHVETSSLSLFSVYI